MAFPQVPERIEVKSAGEADHRDPEIVGILQLLWLLRYSRWQKSQDFFCFGKHSTLDLSFYFLTNNPSTQ